MRIQEVKINNFRSFKNENLISLEKTCKNLFLLGENGSGKSSFCRAVNIFFDASDKRRTESIISKQFRKPFFYEVIEENSSIEIVFSDDRKFKLNKDGFDTDDFDVLSQIRRIKGFLEYKNLLPIYLYANRERNNLFRLFVEGPFSKLRNPKTNKLISTEWFSRTKTKLSTEFFQGVFELATNLEEKINSILKYFDPNIEIAFKSKKTWTTGVLYLEAKVNGAKLINYGDYFNEAKLVALSISIYLAIILKQKEENGNENNPVLNILILDDIFIGMDMSNRIPLLKVLQCMFNDYQIIITSFDEAWYNLSQFYLEDAAWKFLKIFSNSTNHSPQSYILDNKLDDYTEKARFYYDNFDYPACANYQRKAFEKKIKDILPFNLLHYPTEEGPIKKNDKLITNFKNLIDYLKDCMLDTDVFDDFKLYTKILLNPLSHDNSESPVYKREIEALFKILDRLNDIDNKILKKVSEEDKQILKLSIKGSDNIWYQYKYELVDNLRRITQDGKIGYAPCRITIIAKKTGSDQWKECTDSDCQYISEEYDELCSFHGVESKDYIQAFRTNKNISIAEL